MRTGANTQAQSGYKMKQSESGKSASTENKELKPSKPRKWVDPVKNRPARESTLNTTGSFSEFAEFMRKIVNKREEKPKPSSSRAPDAS
jgi:hypothetical protein